MAQSSAQVIERRLMRLLVTVLAVYAGWTLAHQAATFAGISWTRLELAWTWLLAPLLGLSYFWAGQVSAHFASALDLTAPLDPDPPSRWTGFWLVLFTLIAVALVVFVNRPDFDDAEYLQQAIQTLRHPDRPLYSFDASLGTVIDRFRFAPYRITSYETFVALVSDLGHIGLLDAYYLVLPSLWAALSVPVAFLFLRWFLPRPWALLGVGLFLLIAISWGETHVAYGNRMYVRLFQGKGLLIVLTTPLTVLMALLWMRRPSASAWTALLATQVMAVGVSSSGIVITLFATAVGLAAGWLALPATRALARAAFGGATLAYPVALGLWLKFASSAAGKVEDIGTYLPIQASFGGSTRLTLVIATVVTVLVLLARPMVSAWRETGAASTAQTPSASLGWLLVACTVFVLNPLLIGLITEATSRNMNWRLAWAAPVPLMLAASFCCLLMWAHRQRASRRLWAGLLALGLPLAFFAADLPTLRTSNNVTWGFWQHKLPPEYTDAAALARQIRERTDLTQPVTVLVEPRVGTWLTVVAPELRLVMPGHGYRIVLRTIMDAQEMDDRARLVDNVDAVVAGDAGLQALARRYGVTVVAHQRSVSRRERLEPYDLMVVAQN